MDTPDGAMTLRAMVPLFNGDLPAKALVLEMKNHNGKCGCPHCETEGATREGDHLHRYWPYCPAVLRTHTSVMHNAEEAIRNGYAVSCWNENELHFSLLTLNLPSFT